MLEPSVENADSARAYADSSATKMKSTRSFDAQDRNSTHAGQNVLLVDDEERILKALKRLFADEEFKVYTAVNSGLALDILNSQAIDLIISDYKMPGMSGTELLQIVKDKHPQTIRIMLTAFADTRAVMDAVNKGIIYKFITKPWNDDDLKLNVKLALKQYQLIRENITLKNAAKNHMGELSKLKNISQVDRSPLGSILVTKGMITPGQFEMVEKFRKKSSQILYKALIELGMVDEQDLIKIIQNASKVDFVQLSDVPINKELANILGRDLCETGCLVPIRREGHNLFVAMADPLDLERISHLGFATQCNVIPQMAKLEEIQRAIKYLYDGESKDAESEDMQIDFIPAGDDIDLLLDEEEPETADQLLAKSTTPSAVHMVNTVLSDAIKAGASDIHIEPRTKHTVVRYRIDGILQKRLIIPQEMHLMTISRLKILAKMDIAERRVPQDGRITAKTGDRVMDIRVSSMPTINGEKIVCRLLDKRAAVRAIHEIGLRGEANQKLKSIIKLPQGMIIATGPTGSGKTTSLYSMMQEKLSGSLNFITIEDPVEYYLDTATQVHVHEKIGLSFASVLRSTLRQDPDVVLVGEIRDLPTATVAFQAAMTGHLVFTSLHTNDTVSTISRLMNLGIEPYLVASAVQGIVAQRLVRVICPECKQPAEVDREILTLLGIPEDHFPKKAYIGKGCNACQNTGYAGRIGLFELFQMNQEFRQFLTTGYQEARLLNLAKSLGMKTILEDGLEKVAEGITTLDELLRVLGPSSDSDLQCPECGRTLDLKYNTCPYCGTTRRRICKSCSAYLEKDWVACPYCGSR